MAFKNTYPLDSLACTLPYAPVSETSPLVFRLMLALQEEVDPAVLKRAVLDLAPRFPIMYAKLRRGFIWDQLEDASDHDIVQEDEGYPCRPFHIRKGEKPLLRVLYRGNELGFEATHLTCDGTGGSVYLNSLAARYLELQGHTIEKSHNVLDHQDGPCETELADYYQTIYEKPQKMKNPAAPPAFQYLREKKADYLQVTRVAIPLDALKKLVREDYDGYTITHYLGAVYASAFLRLHEKKPQKKRPVRLLIASNLRKYWNTHTLRNFTGMANITVAPDREDAGFGSVLALVRREMQEKLTKENQHALICQTARYLDLFILKFIPGSVKKFLATTVYPPFRRRLVPQTSTLTNLGYIRLPPSLAAHIRSYHLFLGEAADNRITCAAAGVNNIMTVAFSSVSESTVIQDYCIDRFKKDGLPVEVTVGTGNKTHKLLEPAAT